MEKVSRETKMQNKPADWTDAEWSDYLDMCEDMDRRSYDRDPAWDIFNTTPTWEKD